MNIPPRPIVEGSPEPIGDPGEELVRWLKNHEGKSWSDDDLFKTLCEKLHGAGLNLNRACLILGDSHPQVLGRQTIWRPDGGIEQVEVPYPREVSLEYVTSPINVIHQGASAIRRRIDKPDRKLDFPILHDLQSDGATDYAAMALPFSDGSRHFVSWASAREGGFSTDDLAMLDRLMPLIALRIEISHARRLTRTLLRTYLGQHAATRIESGQIRRSEGEIMQAIIVFADLRGFTHMTDTLPTSDLIDVLSLYYEAVAEPLAYFGGDINKLIGDGLLALFPMPKERDSASVDHVACGAVTGVKQAIERLANISPADLPGEMTGLKAGFGLHVGEVAFGNIGSRDRLDFTVVGPAVNEASRVQALTRNLQRPVLTTAAFAELECTVDLEPVGVHALRGFREPKEIFAVKAL